MIKAVLFDIGGVLIYDPDEQIYRKISRELGADYKRTEGETEKLLPELQTGKNTEREFFTRLTGRLGIPFKEEYVNLWKKGIMEACVLNEDVYKVAKELKQSNYQVGIISNIEKSHTEYFRSQPWIRLFCPVVMSNEVGSRKPETEIFDVAIEEVNLSAEECAFVDNKREYVNAANGVGMHGVLFKGDARQLRKELAIIGVKIRTV